MHYDDLNAFRQLCGRPERICWAVAAFQQYRSICPLGWQMWASANPPMIAISMAPARFTHDLITRAGEFVLAWPGADLADATLDAGTRSGRGRDKFDELGLTALPAQAVKAPLVKECLANLECKVVERVTAGDHTIFVGEIVAVHLNRVDGKALLSIGEGSGYDFLLERGGYRFGTVR